MSARAAMTVAALLVAALWAAGPARAITEGEDADAVTWASMAAVLRTDVVDPAEAQICSGTVVGPYAVLTAASCVTDQFGAALDPSSRRVIIGRPNLAGTGGEELAVTAIAVHPSYDPDNPLVHAAAFNVAVLELAGPTSAPAMALATAADDPSRSQTSTGRIAGWGDGAPATGLDVLQSATVSIRADSYCRPNMANMYDPVLMLCTDWPVGTAGPCPGDDGGPILLADRAVQIGVGARRTLCAGSNNQRMVYTRVSASSIAPWIAARIAESVPPPPPPPPPPPVLPPVVSVGSPIPVLVNLRPSVTRTWRTTIRRGKVVRLRYQLQDDNWLTREIISVFNPKGRLVKRVRTKLGTLQPGQVYTTRWKVPKTARVGRWKYCVDVYDGAGLHDRECALLHVRR